MSVIVAPPAGGVDVLYCPPFVVGCLVDGMHAGDPIECVSAACDARCPARNPPILPLMSKADQPAAPQDFETALRELEQLVRDMEQGELTLEQSLAAYKRGMELSAYCQQTLEAAEQQVKVLEDGVLKSFQVENRDRDD